MTLLQTQFVSGKMLEITNNISVATQYWSTACEHNQKQSTRKSHPFFHIALLRADSELEVHMVKNTGSSMDKTTAHYDLIERSLSSRHKTPSAARTPILARGLADRLELNQMNECPSSSKVPFCRTRAVVKCCLYSFTLGLMLFILLPRMPKNDIHS